jgi:hypothetical protein
VVARSAGFVRATERTSAIPAATATSTPTTVSGQARRFFGVEPVCEAVCDAVCEAGGGVTLVEWPPPAGVGSGHD